MIRCGILLFHLVYIMISTRIELERSIAFGPAATPPAMATGDERYVGGILFFFLLVVDIVLSVGIEFQRSVAPVVPASFRDG